MSGGIFFSQKGIKGVREKVYPNFEEAVADIPDGATIMMFCWGIGGTPQNLIRALYDRGTKNLIIISHNFMPVWIGKHIFSLTDAFTPLTLAKQVKKVITSFPGTATLGMTSVLEERINKGEVELEIMSHGTFVERVRAGGSGLGGFYTPVGVGTIVEQGKEKRVIDGKEYIFEKPLHADFGFVRAHKADKRGNLVYRGSVRATNPIIAMACDVTIAEVDEIVEVGELDPEVIVTPEIFVHRIVKIPENGLGSKDHRRTLLRKVFKEG